MSTYTFLSNTELFHVELTNKTSIDKVNYIRFEKWINRKGIGQKYAGCLFFYPNFFA